MDDKGTIAEAVSVDEYGRIMKVGTKQDVLASMGSTYDTLTLQPQEVLMPGFIDPHLHLLPTLMQSLPVTHNLAPCLPPRYSAANHEGCQNYLLDALMTMNPPHARRPLPPHSQGPEQTGEGWEFMVGMNLDPSRQQQPTPDKNGDTKLCSGALTKTSFMENPKQYLEDCVSKDRPVLILDQSGHLAYVNQKAFEATCLRLTGKKECDAPKSVKDGGGAWVSKDGQYTGLLQETSGFQPFLATMQDSLPLGLLHTNPEKFVEQSEEGVKATIEQMRAAGLTTIADGGLSGKSQINAVKFLAERKGFPMRVTGLVTHDAATNEKLTPESLTCDPSKDFTCTAPKWLGVSGIKLWVDGSTQGCTALLENPYAYKNNKGGHCETAGEGRGDFDSEDGIVTALSVLWQDPHWRFQLHANGNLANQWAINAFAQLQLHDPKDKPSVLFIHNTVGNEAISKQISDLRKGTFLAKTQSNSSIAVPQMDAQVTHLIGHVAYWGDVFTKILDGDAKNIDPVGFDRRYEIPFSFHSDSMVTPPRPLWFVEQAVTRTTYAYPTFAHSYPLGREEHAATVDEALRAVTVVPARQHKLDTWLGTIEPRKVADFVRLSANPLNYEPSKKGDPMNLSHIRVVNTYLAGQPTGANIDSK
ncbi:amidohydrolase family protein [Myxococcaceae bacterium GXIMD 01537]